MKKIQPLIQPLNDFYELYVSRKKIKGQK